MSPGRPPLPPDQKRTEWIGTRVTKGELECLYRAARCLRMDVSEYVRVMSLGHFRITKNTQSRRTGYNLSESL